MKKIVDRQRENGNTDIIKLSNEDYDLNTSMFTV